MTSVSIPTFKSSKLSLSNFSGVSLLRIPLTRRNILSFLSLSLGPSLGWVLGGIHRLFDKCDNAPEPDWRVGGLSSRPPKCGETPPLDDCESSMLLIFDQAVTSTFSQKNDTTKKTEQDVDYQYIILCVKV
uniref:Uncharacterized protein n=1 Tax=Arion vulgaris TaxID=1028688 RepID=A0A0B7B4K4_9EUPU